MRNKMIAFCLIVLILLTMPMAVLAENFDSGRLGSVSVTLKEQDGKTPIAGVELSLYYVATVSLNSKNNLSYRYTDAFKNCGMDLADPAFSEKLEDYIDADSVSAGVRKTDAKGKVLFADLPLGLYFVKQTNAVSGYAPCKSFLVTVPAKDAGGYVFDVNASPKTDVEKLITVKIKKVWNTDASAKIADSVSVQLLQNGKVVKTASLNPENNWQVTYKNMPLSDAYSVSEVNVPAGFTATYSKKGYVFTVTNSAALIQTGQLRWPIPVLAIAGIMLIAVGAVILRKSRDNNA